LLPEVVVGGAPEIGTALLEAADGEEDEVAEADTEEGGSKDDNVVGNDDVDEPLCAWAAAKRAFMELMGSEGSSADKGMPAAWAAANKAAFDAEAAADDDDEGLDRLLGGPTLVSGDALACALSERPLLSPQWLSIPLFGVSRPRFIGNL
jgi:hypothetical protein